MSSTERLDLVDGESERRELRGKPAVSLRAIAKAAADGPEAFERDVAR
jgi:hypothetical protein